MSEMAEAIMKSKNNLIKGSITFDGLGCSSIFFRTRTKMRLTGPTNPQLEISKIHPWWEDLQRLTIGVQSNGFYRVCVLLGKGATE